MHMTLTQKIQGFVFVGVLVLAPVLRLCGGLWLFIGSLLMAITAGCLLFLVLFRLLRNSQGRRRWVFTVIAATISAFFAHGLFQELMAVDVVILHPPNSRDTILTFDNRVAVMVSEPDSASTAGNLEQGSIYGRRMTPGNHAKTLRYSVICEKPGMLEDSVGTNTFAYIKARELMINGRVSEVSRFWFFPSERPFLHSEQHVGKAGGAGSALEIELNENERESEVGAD
jgi:hypothetical protein